MARIEMSFTKDELQQLMKMLYTGYFICDREDDTETDRNAKNQLIERFLQTAFTYKAMDGIRYNGESGTHDLDADQEEILLEDYQDFIEESFWDELSFRLGRRDFVNAIGEIEIEKMDLRERIEKEEKYIEKYRKEFEERGIDRISIRK
jgi:hypothetical protein